MAKPTRRVKSREELGRKVFHIDTFAMSRFSTLCVRNKADTIHRAMPISYVRDDTARRIRMSVFPPFVAEDAVNAIYRQAAETTWHYGTVVDLRRAVLEYGGIEALLGHIRQIVEIHGVRGPMALVAWETTTTELLRAYVADARALAQGVDVFRNVNDAERWLDQTLFSPLAIA